MKISLICFTLNGAGICISLLAGLRQRGHEARAFTMGTYAKGPGIEAFQEPLQQWAGRQFEEAEGILFIGAAGIAVRSIAPFIKDKTLDPAVLVMDEKGEFVIPLLSGHIGGANQLAGEIAALMGAMPVITTATDINHKFAVDLFAKKNDLYITRMDLAKAISAAILNQLQIGFKSDFPASGPLPESLSNRSGLEYGICISLSQQKKPFDKTLNLIPRIMTLGVGCRSGKTLDEIEKVVFDRLKANDLSIHGLAGVASIDLKKEEPGILKFCEKYDLMFTTYSAAMLEEAQGIFCESDYVKSVTGVGNVCERAAILSSGNGIMIQKKYAENGVTVSIARKDWGVEF